VQYVVQLPAGRSYRRANTFPGKDLSAHPPEYPHGVVGLGVVCGG
jgi:hypothetical protein